MQRIELKLTYKNRSVDAKKLNDVVYANIKLQFHQELEKLFQRETKHARNFNYAVTIFIRDYYERKKRQLTSAILSSNSIFEKRHLMDLDGRIDNTESIKRVSQKYQVDFETMFSHFAEYEALIEFWDYINLVQVKNNSLQNPSNTNSEFENDKGIQVINSEMVPELLECLKPYFSSEDHHLLREKLECWENVSRKIVFRGNGNKLAFAFRELFTSGIIIGKSKKEMQEWIAENFQFIHADGSRRDFTRDYLEKVISRNFYACKNPIFEIKNNKITKKQQ